RRRAGAPHSLHAHHERLPKGEIEAPPRAPIVREAGREQRRAERAGAAHLDGTAVEARALAAPGHEAFLLERIEDDRELDPSAALVSDRNAELRIAVGEIGGAVERID